MKKKKSFWSKEIDLLAMNFMLLVVLLGLMLYSLNIISLQNQESNPEACSLFCASQNVEYGYVDRNGNCFCRINQEIPDLTNNKTLNITRFIDAGIVSDVKIVDGLPSVSGPVFE